MNGTKRTSERIAQKRQTRFAKAAIARLRAMGAEPTGDDFYRLALGTNAGKFLLHPSELSAMGFANATLFGRFDEPKRAKAAGYGCNPYSGKMNVHLDRIPTIHDATEAAHNAVAEMWRRLGLNPAPTKESY